MPILRVANSVLLVSMALATSGALAADPPGVVEPAGAITTLPAPDPAAVSAEAPATHPHSTPHHPACLTKSEQRAAVASKMAISLGDAIRSLRAHGRRAEVVRARLCRRDEKLAYVLTLLGRSGRVREVTVDAVSGEVIAGR